MPAAALGKDAPWGAYIEAGSTRSSGICSTSVPSVSTRTWPTACASCSPPGASSCWPRAAEAASDQTMSPLTRLARAFDLMSVDLDLLLLCLAPEVNARYLRLFAYLQDDFSTQQLTQPPGSCSPPSRGASALGARFAPESASFATSCSCSGTLATALRSPRAPSPWPPHPRWLLQGEPTDPDLQLGRPRAAGRRCASREEDRGGRRRRVWALSRSPPDLRSCGLTLPQGALVAARHAHTRGAPCSSPTTRPRSAWASGRCSGGSLAREARLQSAVLLVMDPPREDGIDWARCSSRRRAPPSRSSCTTLPPGSRSPSESTDVSSPCRSRA